MSKNVVVAVILICMTAGLAVIIKSSEFDGTRETKFSRFPLLLLKPATADPTFYSHNSEQPEDLTRGKATKPGNGFLAQQEAATSRGKESGKS